MRSCTCHSRERLEELLRAATRGYNRHRMAPTHQSHQYLPKTRIRSAGGDHEHLCAEGEIFPKVSPL